MKKVKLTECPICYEELPTKQMYQLPCGHRVMKECLYEYFKTMVNNNKPEKVECPVHKCNGQKIPAHLLADLLGDHYEKYNRTVNNRRIAQSGGRVFHCPVTPDCPGVISNPGGMWLTRSVLICHDCGG